MGHSVVCFSSSKSQVTIIMKAFVAVIALCADMAKGQVIANAGYGYAGALPYAAGYGGYGYAAAPAAYANGAVVGAPAAYAGAYAAAPVAAYAAPAAEPYVHVEVPAEPYV